MHRHRPGFVAARPGQPDDDETTWIELHCPRCHGYYLVDQMAMDAAQREGRASGWDVYLTRGSGDDVQLVPGGQQGR